MTPTHKLQHLTNESSMQTHSLYDMLFFNKQLVFNIVTMGGFIAYSYYANYD